MAEQQQLLAAFAPKQANMPAPDVVSDAMWRFSVDLWRLVYRCDDELRLVYDPFSDYWFYRGDPLVRDANLPTLIHELSERGFHLSERGSHPDLYGDGVVLITAHEQQ